jgi:hypothetical protein
MIVHCRVLYMYGTYLFILYSSKMLIVYSCILGASLTPDNIAKVLGEVPPLINESDLHISQVCVQD